MANVSLWGVDYTNVPAIDVPMTGGGTSRFWDMSNGETEWMGLNVTLDSANSWTSSTKLKDTGFSTWTPSTTAATVEAATSHSTFTGDLENYEYAVQYLWDVNVVYDGTEAQKALLLREYGCQTYFICRRPSTLTSMTTGTSPYNASMSMNSSAYYAKYYNGSSTLTSAAAPGYGIWLYYSGTEPSLSSTSSVSPTITLKNPAIRARCSTTYLSTGNCGKINQEDTLFKVACKVYKIEIGSTPIKGQYEACRWIYNNPL